MSQAKKSIGKPREVEREGGKKEKGKRAL